MPDRGTSASTRCSYRDPIFRQRPCGIVPGTALPTAPFAQRRTRSIYSKPLDHLRASARPINDAASCTDTMEATPAQGVQVRTAGGRVATVTLCDKGWYSATLDDKVHLAPDEGGAGESITKRRSFFAADQGELGELAGNVPTAGRERDDDDALEVAREEGE